MRLTSAFGLCMLVYLIFIIMLYLIYFIYCLFSKIGHDHVRATLFKQGPIFVMLTSSIRLYPVYVLKLPYDV
jgi:hypothetical protein